jgi:DNA polymerase-3 subunit epsilon
MEFAVVDIETTGSHHSNDCITEIGIVITDGYRILETYETLINPNEKIGWYVSKLTGITDKMVANAPEFSEVAETIFQYIQNRIFVAHNVNFDYNIIKGSLEKCGYKMPTKRLCSLRLSRTILPGYQSYGLGNITKTLGISLENAHRAMGDAMATTHLFHILFEKNTEEVLNSLKTSSKEATLPPNLPKKSFEVLPETAGVYYFYDSKGKIIYIGKAKNIKKRVTTHFSGKNSIAKKGLLENIFGVSFTETGNEVIASLLEENEIKQYWPEYNYAQKSIVLNYGLYKYFDNNGIVRLAINKIANQNKGLIQFTSIASARNWLIKKIDYFKLKPEYCGFLNYDKGDVSDSEHQENVNHFLRQYLLNEDTVVWHGAGRTFGEMSFVLMENGTYLGYGFIENSIGIEHFESLKYYLIACHDTYQCRKILGSSKTNKLKKVVIPKTYSTAV